MARKEMIVDTLKLGKILKYDKKHERMKKKQRL